LRSEVQLAPTDVNTTNVVMDISSSIQTQLSAIDYTKIQKIL